MLFRVSSFDICHIYRMEKEHVYMTVGEPESSVILKYIWGTASEQEKGEVDLWLKKHPENEKALLQIARIYYVCRTQERIVSRDPLKAYWKVDKMLKSQLYLKLNSTCKCNRILINNLFKFFVWREVSKSFTRSIIEFIFNPLNLFVGYFTKVLTLWDILPDKPVGVFIGTTFP